ncbi:MAG TPA: hypothetical protein VN690_11650 [Terriglobales bacterium]|nr:hypothetical protein [Terriglobales bacterium]
MVSFGSAVSWVLVFHLVGMVMWIGGLFMALAAATAKQAQLAQRGMRRFAHPGAALMIITGGLLFYLLPFVRLQAWLHAKLLLVAILIVVDLLFAAGIRRMPAQVPTRGQLAFYHSAVGTLFLLILILVLIKPF